MSAVLKAALQLVKKVLAEWERKGKELREKPIRGFSRFQSEVFWNFLKVQKTCSGCRKDIFYSLRSLKGSSRRLSKIEKTRVFCLI